MKYTRADFPDGFLFGAATSSYQIEGHAFGGAGETQWNTFAATPDNVVRNENGQIACDHYRRYEEDFDLLADADAIENGKVNDQNRVAYLDRHPDAVRNALSASVPVAGHYIWSLLDNYEWALGYEKRCGLIHADFDTLKRTPKASYRARKAALRRPPSACFGQEPSS